MAGVWGKLRGHGDFLALGLDEAARAAVVPWLDGALAALRDEWGEAWGPRFDAMGLLGFWMGPAVTGGAALAGVMAPSRDRVGRRYPLLILGRGEVAPPMLVPSGFHDRAGAALAALLAAGQAEAGAWPQPLAEAAPAAPPEDPSLVWARNPGCSGGALLAEILRYDHAAACAGRVQVWTLAAPGVVLTCDGLPTARALGWLIEASQSEASRAADGPVDGHSEILAEPLVPVLPLAAALPSMVPEAAPSLAGGGDLPEPQAATAPALSAGPAEAAAGTDLAVAGAGAGLSQDVAAADMRGSAGAAGAGGASEPGKLEPGQGLVAAGLSESHDAQRSGIAPEPMELEGGVLPGQAVAAAGLSASTAIVSADVAPDPQRLEALAGPEGLASQGFPATEAGNFAHVARPEVASDLGAAPLGLSPPGAADRRLGATGAASADTRLMPQASGEPESASAPEEHAPAASALRLEPRFRLGAEEQADSRLLLRSEWALPEGAARPRVPVDAAIWQLPEPPAAAPAAAPANAGAEPPREAE